MGTLAQLFVARAMAYIHAETGGEGSECRVGTAERGRHNANGEEHHDRRTERTAACKHGQQFVTLVGQSHSLLLCQQHQQHAQREEEQVGRHKGKAVGTHILACLFQILARQVLLHHVLVEASHHNHDEDAAEKLFHEMLAIHPIVEHEDAAVGTLRHGLHRLAHAHAQPAGHLHKDEHHSREQAKGLKRVGPYQRADASPASIEPYQRHHQGHRQGKGQMHLAEYKALQQHTHHIEAHRRTHNLGNKEEHGGRAACRGPYTFARKRIDGGEVHAVIQGQQHPGHHEISGNKAQASLQIGHVAAHHHAGHRHQGDAADGCTHHAEGHHIPGRPAMATIKFFVRGALGGETAHGKEQRKIEHHGEKHQHEAADFWMSQSTCRASSTVATPVTTIERLPFISRRLHRLA